MSAPNRSLLILNNTKFSYIFTLDTSQQLQLNKTTQRHLSCELLRITHIENFSTLT